MALAAVSWRSQGQREISQEQNRVLGRGPSTFKSQSWQKIPRNVRNSMGWKTRVYVESGERRGGALPRFSSGSPSPALTLVPLLTSTKASLSWVSALPPAHMYVLGVYHAPEYQCWVPELSAVPCLSLPTHHCSAYSNLVP